VGIHTRSPRHPCPSPWASILIPAGIPIHHEPRKLRTLLDATRSLETGDFESQRSRWRARGAYFGTRGSTPGSRSYRRKAPSFYDARASRASRSDDAGYFHLPAMVSPDALRSRPVAETIPDAAHALNEPSRASKLSAKALDVCVDRARLTLRVEPPNVAKERFSRLHAVSAVGQGEEKLEF